MRFARQCAQIQSELWKIFSIENCSRAAMAGAEHASEKRAEGDNLRGRRTRTHQRNRQRRAESVLERMEKERTEAPIVMIRMRVNSETFHFGSSVSCYTGCSFNGREWRKKSWTVWNNGCVANEGLQRFSQHLHSRTQTERSILSAWLAMFGFQPSR